MAGGQKLSERTRAAFETLRNLRVVDSRSSAHLTADIEHEPDFKAIYDRVGDFTMSSVERMYALYRASRYVVENQVPGDFVETGVWRGGSTMLSALTFASLGDTSRDLWLYDTYEGMVEPTEVDRSWDGQSAQAEYETTDDWCAASLGEVQRNMASTGYPSERIHYVEGRVEETIPSAGVPDRISLLRLDTDWYVSNSHEMKHLFPRLSSGGVLILDDYGHWEGVRRSVDEYFAEHGITQMLHRIDYSGRLLIKA